MRNPYRDLPDHAFWRRAISNLDPEHVDPVVEVPFSIGRQCRVATAGSCFAQHISRNLVREGYRYLVTEAAPLTSHAVNEGYEVFSARYGNIYTVRQLLQLFQRAYGLFEPKDVVWCRDDGAFADPYRPQIQTNGFASVQSVEDDRFAHLAAVRAMFETCDVFIYTLGLTEGWINTVDGAVFPLAPGVAGSGNGQYRFENFAVAGMIADLTAFIVKLRTLTPNVRIVLTVSPVPVIATYEQRHVLVSTIYSKSALRVVAEVVAHSLPDVAYFPSYEIITGPQAR